MAPLSRRETDDSPNFFIPIGAIHSQAISAYPLTAKMCEIPSICCATFSVSDVSLSYGAKKSLSYCIYNICRNINISFFPTHVYVLDIKSLYFYTIFRLALKLV